MPDIKTTSPSCHCAGNSLRPKFRSFHIFLGFFMSFCFLKFPVVSSYFSNMSFISRALPLPYPLDLKCFLCFSNYPDASQTISSDRPVCLFVCLMSNLLQNNTLVKCNEKELLGKGNFKRGTQKQEQFSLESTDKLLCRTVRKVSKSLLSIFMMYLTMHSSNSL